MKNIHENKSKLVNDKNYNKKIKKIKIILTIIASLFSIIGTICGIYFGIKRNNENRDISNSTNNGPTYEPNSTSNSTSTTNTNYISTCKFENSHYGIGIYNNCNNTSNKYYPQEKDCTPISSYKSLEYTLNNTKTITQLNIYLYKDLNCKDILKPITKSGKENKEVNECINNFFIQNAISMNFNCTV